MNKASTTLKAPQTTHRRSVTRKRNRGGLRSSYGVVTLPKGMRLYHASTTKLCAPPNKPVIFTTLHPSEWYTEDSHISVFECQRDIDLLFMIKSIRGMRIISSLNEYLDPPTNNLAKMNYANIQKWIPFLERERLDGWMSSIENKSAIEFALINNESIRKLVQCLPIHFNWSNSSYNNDAIVPKQWGNAYPIHTRGIKLTVNARFRPQIESYIEYVKTEDPRGTAFSLLLEDATISYIDAPIETFRWPI